MFNAQAILDDAARRIGPVVDGLKKFFSGAEDEFVNNGTADIPTLANLAKQALDGVDSVAGGAIQAAIDANTQAQVAKDTALLAADSAGIARIYATKAAANDDLENRAEGEWIEVCADESVDDSPRTRYKVVSGAYVLGVNLDQLRTDLSEVTGLESIGTNDGGANAQASLNGRVQRSALYADLRAITPANAALVPTASVSGGASVSDGRQGELDWIVGDQSANVSADPRQAIWITSDSDPTGLLGAWKRRIKNGVLNAEWFGITMNATTTAQYADNALAANAMVAVTRLLRNSATPIRLTVFPPGYFDWSDTILFNTTVHWRAAGRDMTYFRFRNAVSLKAGFRFVRGSAKSSFEDMSIADSVFGTSRGIEFYDTISGSGSPVWKNMFTRVEITGFRDSHAYLSDNPLNNANHAACSEMLWLHCRFVNNVRIYLNQNAQAVNNTYLHCDGENFDGTYFGTPITDANNEFFRDEAGGHVKVRGGSWIGRGPLYTWKHPGGSSGLFQGSGWFDFKGQRLELRSVHNGALIVQDPTGSYLGSSNILINVSTGDFVTNGQTIDLIRCAGRVNASFDNINTAAGTGLLNVRVYPTVGVSANTSTGSQGGIDIRNCGNVGYIKETSSPYGTYNADYTLRVSRHDQKTSSTNASFSTDADGWQTLTTAGDIQQMGFRFGTVGSFGRIVVNQDNVTGGFSTSWKLTLPKYGRPFRLFAFKHPQQFANDTGFALYLAKDKANWVNPASFDYTTDATLVATMPSTAGKAGWFSADVQLTSNVLGGVLQSGFGSWTEGRIYLLKLGASNFPGFVGVEYA